MLVHVGHHRGTCWAVCLAKQSLIFAIFFGETFESFAQHFSCVAEDPPQGLVLLSSYLNIRLHPHLSFAHFKITFLFSLELVFETSGTLRWKMLVCDRECGRPSDTLTKNLLLGDLWLRKAQHCQIANDMEGKKSRNIVALLELESWIKILDLFSVKNTEALLIMVTRGLWRGRD